MYIFWTFSSKDTV